MKGITIDALRNAHFSGTLETTKTPVRTKNEVISCIDIHNRGRERDKYKNADDFDSSINPMNCGVSIGILVDEIVPHRVHIISYAIYN